VADKVIEFSSQRNDGFELVDVGKTFGKDTDIEIENWLHDDLRSKIEGHADLHKSKIPKLRGLYLGKPKSESKAFPFANASNIVIQVIGDRVDTMTARILGFVFATSPLWKYMYPAVTDTPNDSDKKRSVLQEFMDIVGYEPGELDLYRIYGQWCTEHCMLGTSFVKAYIENCVEAVAVGYTDAKKTKRKFDDETIYEGPRVEKLAHEDVLMDAGAQTIEKSRLVAQRRPLKKFDLEERAFTGFYDKEAVAKILEKPDRGGPDTNKVKELAKKGVRTTQSSVNAEWDVYECYFPWLHNGSKFRLIYSYHLSSRTVLRKVFNFIPANQTPIVRAKLGYRNDGAYGYGFAELLEKYQEEVSTTHNNRIDNSTLANTRFFRIGPSAVNIGSQVDIFPSGAITANKDDFEAYQIADVYQSSFQNETMTLELADQRAGIAPAVAGSGSGGMTGKGKGATYSSMGTLAMMQEGNHRTNLATSDFRHAHQKLGSLLTGLYAKFGVGDRGKMFGKDEHYLTEALKEFLSSKCRIPIRSTTASLNREVEKQNDMLMIGLMQRHYTAQAQLMQAINNPMIPPQVKDYLTRVMDGSDRIMKRILKDFGYDQPEEFIPEASKALQTGGQPSAPQAQDPRAIAAAIAAKSSVAQPVLPSSNIQGDAGVSGVGGPQGRPQ
jgi:hypothetical protein